MVFLFIYQVFSKRVKYCLNCFLYAIFAAIVGIKIFAFGGYAQSILFSVVK